LFYEQLIRSYVVAPYFVERPDLMRDVETKLKEKSCRFLLITGEPGTGKTAFMAWLAHRNPDWARYFIRRDQISPLGPAGARSLLMTAGFQLAARYPSAFSQDEVEISIRQRLTKEGKGSLIGAEIGRLISSPFRRVALDIIQEVEQTQGLVLGLRVHEWITDPRLIPYDDLQHMALYDPADALARTRPQERAVILIDALDEQWGGAHEGSIVQWLENAPELPGNVRIVLASRPVDAALAPFRARQQPWLCELTISPDAESVRRDVRRMAERFAEQDYIVDALLDHDLESDAFVEAVVGKAMGNFQYLNAVLREIDRSLKAGDTALVGRLLRAEEMPETLEELYAYFLRLIRSQLEGSGVPISPAVSEDIQFLPAWQGLYQPMLGILSVGKSGLTLEQIRELGQIPVLYHWLSGARERMIQFLDPEDEQLRLYHSTFPEFLTAPQTRDTYSDCYLPPLEWHRTIATHVLTAYAHDWPACDDYGLNFLVQHMLDAEMTERLKTVFTDEFMNARLARTGWHMPFVDDLERVEARFSPEEMVDLYLGVVYGRGPNSLVMQRVTRRLLHLRPQLKHKRIDRPDGGHPQLDDQIDEALASLDPETEVGEETISNLFQQYKVARNPQVKSITALVMGESGHPSAVAPLRQILLDPKAGRYGARVSWCAADGLLALNTPTIIDPELVATLRADLDRQDVPIDAKQRVVYVLGRLRLKLPLEEAIDLVETSLNLGGRVRGRAVDLLWLLLPSDTAARQHWVERFERPYLWKELGFEPAVPHEQSVSGPPDEWIEKRMVTALGRIGSPEAVPHLLRLARTAERRPSPKGRYERATRTLQRMRHELKRSIQRAIRDIEHRHG
jgi:HEAT repeat protein